MNPSELVVKAKLESEGWEVLRDGWPDFLAINSTNGQIKFVEVKGDGDRVRPNQQRVHDILRSLGLTVEVIQFGTPGFPPERLLRGYCPGCREIVAVRKNGMPYNHAGSYQDRYICPSVLYDDDDPDCELLDELLIITEFISGEDK